LEVYQQMKRRTLTLVEKVSGAVLLCLRVREIEADTILQERTKRIGSPTQPGGMPPTDGFAASHSAKHTHRLHERVHDLAFCRLPSLRLSPLHLTHGSRVACLIRLAIDGAISRILWKEIGGQV
jgi:hypothetical protein